MCTCTNVYVHVYMCKYVYIELGFQVQMHMYMYIYMCKYVYIELGNGAYTGVVS